MNVTTMNITCSVRFFHGVFLDFYTFLICSSFEPTKIFEEHASERLWGNYMLRNMCCSTKYMSSLFKVIQRGTFLHIFLHILIHFRISRRSLNKSSFSTRCTVMFATSSNLHQGVSPE